jgi:hypothetical protein
MSEEKKYTYSVTIIEEMTGVGRNLSVIATAQKSRETLVRAFGMTIEELFDSIDFAEDKEQQ